jgi:hypothetical protein
MPALTHEAIMQHIVFLGLMAKTLAPRRAGLCLTGLALLMNACSGDGTQAEQAGSALSACVRRAPKVTLSPETSGPVDYGVPFDYTLSITNQDDAACSAAEILFVTWYSEVSVTFPVTPRAGSVYALPSFVLDPGQTGQTVLRVTEAGTRLPGTYQVRVTAASRELFDNTVNAAATFQLEGEVPCIHRPASVSITPAVSSPVTLGTAVDYTLTILNNDTPKCPPNRMLYGVPTASLQISGTTPLPRGLAARVEHPVFSFYESIGDIPALEPGSSVTARVQITSTPELTPGLTGFRLYAARVDSARQQLVNMVSASATYHLAAAP